MKLYGRLLLTLASSGFKDKVEPLDSVVSNWTVLPNDLDLFGHMNNGRYAMVMDLARVDFIARLGMLGKLFKKRWMVPVGLTQIEYRKPLKPFMKYEIHTRLCYWDDKWFYFKQDFIPKSAQHTVAATGYVKALFVSPKGAVPIQQVIDEVMAQQAVPVERPPLTLELAKRFDLSLKSVASVNTEIPVQVEPSSIPFMPPARPAPIQTPENYQLSQTNEREPIAIVGIGCRFPGGVENPEDLWDVLVQGKDCVIDIPSTRWDPKKFYDASGLAPGRAYVNKAGMLTQDINQFDATFFGISPREAEVMDPMQRLLLEVSWEAFEDAGISPKSLAGKPMAVYVGGFVIDSMVQHYSPLNRKLLGTQSATGNSLTLLANRLSYFYDLRGPSISLDTACSSSLVAVHQACQSIWSGETDSALVGGVNMLLTPETHITMCKGHFLSPNGRCNTFGSGADGYVRGEGSALVVLKPLSKALADGNKIYSVIRGAASNQDGRTNGITVPNGEAQQQAMRKALAMANIAPSQINYMEAHGTGTAVGDPIEANALGQVLGEARQSACPIGSLKTNLGHMEASAGIGGLIKAALVLKHRTLVPHLHLTEVNPAIDLAALKLRVPTQVEAINQQGPLFAGVNSFGYGGTNAHVILESPPEPATAFCEPANPLRSVGLCLSAETEGALKQRAAAMLEQLSNPASNVQHLAIAHATQRSHLSHRVWIQGGANSVQAKTEVMAGLQDFIQGKINSERVQTGLKESKRLMFVYTGMGPQWWAMGRQLFEKEPVFKTALEECEGIFKKISGWSLLDELLADQSASRITQTQIAQPANLAIQVALTKLLASWGIIAEGIVGHSIGEVGSAWASGGLSLESALTVAYHRSRLQAKTAGKGGMLAVGVDLDQALDYVAQHEGKVSIGAINSPSSITLSGDLPALQLIAADLEAQQKFNRFLKVEVPYHSPIMNEIEGELKQALESIQSSPMHTPLYSTVSGELMGTDESMQGGHDAAYWWRNVREAVMFSKAIHSALEDGFNAFIEIGPHPVLAGAMVETARASSRQASLLSTLTREADEMHCLAQLVGKLYCQGAELDWATYLGRASLLSLPAYPWDRQVYRYEGERAKRYRLPYQGHPLVTRETDNPVPTWHIELNRQALPYVQDHQVSGSILFPGSGYVELGLALAKAQQEKTNQDASGIVLEKIEFLKPATVYANEAVSLSVQADELDQRFKVHYQQGENAPELCAQGFFYSTGLRKEYRDQSKTLALFEGAEAEGYERLEHEYLYERLAGKGLVYGSGFRAVQQVLIRQGETLAQIQLPAQLSSAGYLLHPVLLDAALHSLIAGLPVQDADYNVIPMGIEQFQWFGHQADEIIAHGIMRPQSKNLLRGDVDLFTKEGLCLARLKGLNCRILAKPASNPLHKINQWVYQKEWRKLPESHAALAESAQFLVLQAGSEAGSTELLLLGSDKQPLALPENLTKNFSEQNLLAFIQAQASELSIIDARFLSLQHKSVDVGEHTPDLTEQATTAAGQLLATLKTLADCELQRYVLLTPAVQKVLDADPVNLLGSVLEGMARTAMTECPALHLTLLDLDLASANTLALPELCTRIAHLGEEQEVAMREQALYTLRLCQSKLDAPKPVQQWLEATELAAFEMKQGEQGRFESLYFAEMPLPQATKGQLVVEMAYSSLHFKDLMKVMGLLSEEALSNTYHKDAIGMEGSGIVTEVGEGVTEYAVGDRVYVWGPVIRSHILVEPSNVVKLPAELSLETGANLVTYFTVYHSFVEMARLQAGETVLIHSATGGVGLAAINIARKLGARIFATAGTAEKRAYLEQLGVEYVGDSRSLDFVDEVRGLTGGKGVDVVLNFTPGEIMKKSIDCLSPSGRFIELGKQSSDKNEALRLRPFLENLSYMSVDFDRLTQQRPVYVLSIVQAVLDLLVSGELPALPCQVFPLSEIDTAFRTMARSNYIGKLALRHERKGLQVQARTTQTLFSNDASYVITGGLGGFGLQVAQWMAGNGARHLVLLSRSGACSEEAQLAVRTMQAMQVEVKAVAVDVSDLAALGNVWQDVQQSMPPIKGVMHAAMVLDDKKFTELDLASLTKVVAAKAKGAWNLHQLTQSMELDFMVLFSSISSLVGNAGQANYVAANNFLDQLAHYRRSQGLAATSINWGVFEETGVVARNSHLAKHLNHIGIVPFSSAEATQALSYVLQNELTQVGIMNVDWSRFSGMLADGAGKSRFSELLLAQHQADETEQGSQHLLNQFSAMDEESRQVFIRSALIETVAEVMRLDVEKVKPTSSLRDLGLDSLMAVEIDVAFSEKTGLDIPSADISSGPRIEQLEARLLARLNSKVSLPEELESV